MCPNGTMFHQLRLVCDWWYNVECDLTPLHVGVNAEIGRVDPPKRTGGRSPILRGSGLGLGEFEEDFNSLDLCLPRVYRPHLNSSNSNNGNGNNRKNNVCYNSSNYNNGNWKKNSADNGNNRKNNGNNRKNRDGNGNSRKNNGSNNSWRSKGNNSNVNRNNRRSFPQIPQVPQNEQFPNIPDHNPSPEPPVATIAPTTIARQHQRQDNRQRQRQQVFNAASTAALFSPTSPRPGTSFPAAQTFPQSGGVGSPTVSPPLVTTRRPQVTQRQHTVTQLLSSQPQRHSSPVGTSEDSPLPTLAPQRPTSSRGRGPQPVGDEGRTRGQKISSVTPIPPTRGTSLGSTTPRRQPTLTKVFKKPLGSSTTPIRPITRGNELPGLEPQRRGNRVHVTTPPPLIIGSPVQVPQNFGSQVAGGRPLASSGPQVGQTVRLPQGARQGILLSTTDTTGVIPPDRKLPITSPGGAPAVQLGASGPRILPANLPHLNDILDFVRSVGGRPLLRAPQGARPTPTTKPPTPIPFIPLGGASNKHAERERQQQQEQVRQQQQILQQQQLQEQQNLINLHRVQQQLGLQQQEFRKQQQQQILQQQQLIDDQKHKIQQEALRRQGANDQHRQGPNNGRGGARFTVRLDDDDDFDDRFDGDDDKDDDKFDVDDDDDSFILTPTSRFNRQVLGAAAPLTGAAEPPKKSGGVKIGQPVAPPAETFLPPPPAS
ncbi:hypothetical protein HAZT_HAZT011430 [Hyalella azteca]|uniref:Chitin-binding type-2 domain-containing protein n=1 Tax=Hyalella azteca TaxID=294128 RepID=A0A6A0GXQ0_HYAAZ|nr:hypothetical protein HAZT_HAZT011430 [Hyalella azteca]